jgi:hypothetical protein
LGSAQAANDYLQFIRFKSTITNNNQVTQSISTFGKMLLHLYKYKSTSVFPERRTEENGAGGD